MSASCFCLLSLLPGSYSPVFAETPTEAEQQISQLKQQLREQQQQLNELTEQLGIPEHHTEGKLDLTGFFDVTAHTTDSSEHPFDLGSLELDIEFEGSQNVAVSTALVWDGEVTEVAVAVLDYHVMDHTIPARGKLYEESGYHLQFGRFDIPFGLDYQFFAAPDRVNVSAPLTTELIQGGGFNGDGIRAYGNSSRYDYAVYWTNSLFEDNGTSLGTRVGLFSARDADSQTNFIVGLSWLYDMDSDEERRNTVRALDLTWRSGIVELMVEYLQLDRVGEIVLAGGGSAGPADEEGYNVRLKLDLEPWVVFVGYEEWAPDYTAVVDEEDPAISYTVDDLERLIVSTGYTFDDYLLMKLEYYNYLGSKTLLPDFEERRLTFQMVALF